MGMTAEFRKYCSASNAMWGNAKRKAGYRRRVPRPKSLVLQAREDARQHARNSTAIEVRREVQKDL